MGKPFRGINKFHPYQNGCIITSDNDLSNYGLNKYDYANLKWEDEPVEVFLNLENLNYKINYKIYDTTRKDT